MNLIDLFEERAAIMEYDGGMTREEAERLAALDVARLTEKARENEKMEKGVANQGCP
jgi:hypothetical protein